MSRSFRRRRHPENLACAAKGAWCDHLSPLRNAGRVNRHLIQRLRKRRKSARSLRKPEPHVFDNERHAYYEFVHAHRLGRTATRVRRLERARRQAEEQTARKRDVAERYREWLADRDAPHVHAPCTAGAAPA